MGDKPKKQLYSSLSQPQLHSSYGQPAYEMSQSVHSVQPKQMQCIQQSSEPKPNNHLPFSILTCIICFPPLGIAAIVFSLMSTNEWSRGHKSKAFSYAHKAKILNYVGLGVGLVYWAVLAVGIYLWCRSLGMIHSTFHLWYP